MKNTIAILLFVFLAHSALIASVPTSPSRYIVFQPDNRTLSLSNDDVNRIWKTLEKLAATSGEVMPRESFLSMLGEIQLMDTGSNLRSDISVKQRLVAKAGSANLVFTRVISWGGHFNVSIEIVSTPNFTIKRAALPLSEEIETIDQIISRIPELMQQLGIIKPKEPNAVMSLYMMPPENTSRQLDTFYSSLQKYLEADGIKMTNDSSNKLQLTVKLDTFDSSSQTLYLPMQKRQIVKSNVNMKGKLFLKNNDETTIIPFQKSTNATSKTTTDQFDIDSFIDSIARESVNDIIKRLYDR